MSLITLQCPKCGDCLAVDRIDSDPPEPIYRTDCPECADREGDVTSATTQPSSTESDR